MEFEMSKPDYASYTIPSVERRKPKRKVLSRASLFDEKKLTHRMVIKKSK